MIASIYLFILIFQDRVYLFSPHCLENCSVDKAGLKLIDLPASASQMLRLMYAPPGANCFKLELPYDNYFS